MKPSTPPVAPQNEDVREQLFSYAIRMASWLVIIFLSRCFLLATGVTLLIPITFFIATIFDSISVAWPLIWHILYWPWALTGRTSFNENDLGLLVFSWATAIVIIVAIIHKLLPSFKIKLRYVLISITAIYVVTVIGILIHTGSQDREAGFVMFLLLYVVCIASVAFSWGLNSLSALLKKESLTY